MESTGGCSVATVVAVIFASQAEATKVLNVADTVVQWGVTEGPAQAQVPLNAGLRRSRARRRNGGGKVTDPPESTGFAALVKVMLGEPAAAVRAPHSRVTLLLAIVGHSKVKHAIAYRNHQSVIRTAMCRLRRKSSHKVSPSWVSPFWREMLPSDTVTFGRCPRWPRPRSGTPSLLKSPVGEI